MVSAKKNGTINYRRFFLLPDQSQTLKTHLLEMSLLEHGVDDVEDSASAVIGPGVVSAILHRAK